MTNIDQTSGTKHGTDGGGTSGGNAAARSFPPVAMKVDGPALANSTTPTSLLDASGKATLPALDFAVPRVFLLTAAGRISNIVTTPGTFTLEVHFGAVTVFSGGAVQLNAAAKTNVGWTLRAYLTVRAVGAGTAANVMGQGEFSSESVVGAASGTMLTASLPASAPAVGTGFDSTVNQLVDLFGTFSIGNAGNAITCHQFVLAVVA